MVHPCPCLCCRLRFATTGEHEAHVRDDHTATDATPEAVLSITRNPTHVGPHHRAERSVPLRR